MEAFFLVVTLALLLTPIIALALAIAALGRIGRLQTELQQVRAELRRLRSGLPPDAASAAPASPASAAGPVVRAAPAADAPTPPPASAPPAASAIPAVQPAMQTPLPRAVVRPLPHQPVATPTPASTTPKRGNLEHRIGARLTVWIGGIALALCGVFLVKHMAEQGMMGPQTRVIVACCAGVLMLGVGEAMRRRYRTIAQGVTAAGVAMLYVAVMSAVTLHGLIAPIPGFIMLAAITAAAVGLSLRHGPFVALLGLIGGFLTPAMIGARQVSTVNLFGFLILLEIGLMFVTRRQRWYWLSLLTLVGSLGWVAIWIMWYFEESQRVWAGLFVLTSMVTFIASSVRSEDGWRGLRVRDVAPWLAMAPGLALVGWLARAGGFTWLEWGQIALVSAGTIALGRLRETYRLMPVLALVLGLVLVVMWGEEGGGREAEVLEPTMMFAWVCGVMAAIFCVGGYASMWGAARPGFWAAITGAALVMYLAVAHAYIDGDVPWGQVAGITTLIAAAGAGIRHAARKEVEEPGAAVLVIATSTLAVLSVFYGIPDAWQPMSIALLAPAVALVGRAWRLDAVRITAVVVAALGVFIVAFDPTPFTKPIAPHVAFNGLWFAYGVPTLAFTVATALLERPGGGSRLARFTETFACITGVLLVTYLIDHAFHPGRLDPLDAGLYETATWTVAWLALSIGMLGSGMRWGRWALYGSGVFVAVMGMWCAIVGVALTASPLFNHESVGATPVFNGLLYAVGAPAALTLLLAAAVAPPMTSTQRVIGTIARGVTLVLAFTLISLEVRQYFQGAYLDGARPSQTEWYAYSAAWIVFAALLIALGVWRDRKPLRLAGLGVMLVTVLKVFLFDTRHLTDLWRVASFAGLGVSLLALAFVYQRFSGLYATGGGGAGEPRPASPDVPEL